MRPLRSQAAPGAGLARECLYALEARGLPVAIVTLPRARGEDQFAVAVLVTSICGRPTLIECLGPHVSNRGRLARQLERFAAAGWKRIPVHSIGELTARVGLGPWPWPGGD